MKKRGLSNVVASFLLITIALVAVVVLGTVVFNLFNNTQDGIDSSFRNLLNRDSDVGVDGNVELPGGNGVTLSPVDEIGNPLDSDDLVLPEANLQANLDNLTGDGLTADLYGIVGSGTLTGAVVNEGDVLIESYDFYGESFIWQVPSENGKYYFSVVFPDGTEKTSNYFEVKDLEFKTSWERPQGVNLVFGKSNPEWSDLSWDFSGVRSPAEVKFSETPGSNYYSWTYFSRENRNNRTSDVWTDSLSTEIERGKAFSFDMDWVTTFGTGVTGVKNLSIILKDGSDELFRFDTFCENGNRFNAYVEAKSDGNYYYDARGPSVSCTNIDWTNVEVGNTDVNLNGTSYISFGKVRSSSISQEVKPILNRTYYFDSPSDDLTFEIEITGKHDVTNNLLLNFIGGKVINPDVAPVGVVPVNGYSQGTYVEGFYFDVWNTGTQDASSSFNLQAELKDSSRNVLKNYIGFVESLKAGEKKEEVNLVPTEELVYQDKLYSASKNDNKIFYYTVTLDSESQISETDETDNSLDRSLCVGVCN